MSDRRFAPVSGYEGRVELPRRKTAGSAGYDLAAVEETEIPVGAVRLIRTGLKAYMAEDEVLLLYVRSSLAVKRSLMLANGVGVVDSDYVDNPDNEGHIMVAVFNAGAQPARVEAGERVAQGIFVRYLTTTDDEPTGQRTGGFGSTGRA